MRELTVAMALPFDMARTSLGFALLTPATRELGRRAAEETARALSELTRSAVSVAGRPLPCTAAPCAGAVWLGVELTALPGTASVEVEASLAVALLDLLGGGPGRREPAASVTPLERSALELAVLTALDALGSLPDVEGRLAPRLVRAPCEPLTGLSVDLSISLGERPGRARLILPAAAVRALGAPGFGDACEGPAASALLELSLRCGSAPLDPGELAALEAGDIVLLDRSPPGRLAAVAPGGLRFEGTETQDDLTIEEVRMPDAASEYPVTLEVELARVPVTLGELARLEPGAILPLPIDRRGRVTLKLGDRTLGRGELVDVEGSVGVRIDSLSQEHR